MRTHYSRHFGVETAQRAGVTLERTTLYKDPFEDLRETFLAIGKVLDMGRRWFVVQDPKAQEYGVLMRFLTILHVDGAGTPGIILLYRAVTARDGPDGAEWASYIWKRDNERMGQPGLGASTVFASPLEAKLLLKLLEINARMLVPEYQPPKERFEGRFNTSVLFPMAPLSFKALGHLNHDPGCAVCGKKQVKRCARCQSISYGGTGCQKIDWREHKIKWRSLADGRWVTVSFRMKFPGDENRPYMTLSQRMTNSPQDVQAFINNSMNMLRPVDQDIVHIPPPNVHGERTFLIKIQTPMNPRNPGFMIYDRHKSFGSVFFCQQDNPELYREFLVETRGPRGGYGGHKMYRWARRTGDFELSVCLDKAPETGTMDAIGFSPCDRVTQK
ncbi:hypothetical protein C8Q74DRAFT_970140 [Fomes fomentarius]|nr:hypothetical protein C8Q74DRAFT_970140 [Fomes fomentarius]